jgi:hypothetical protein
MVPDTTGRIGDKDESALQADVTHRMAERTLHEQSAGLVAGAHQRC